MLRRFKIITASAIMLLAVCVAGGLGQAASGQGPQWWMLRSRSFTLLGNAPLQDLESIAARLERFGDAIAGISGDIPRRAAPKVNVIVFNSDAEYAAFKPLKRDGGPDAMVTGFSQLADDVSYITVAAGRTDVETLGTLYHEYVHHHLATRFRPDRIPAWANEGLAEFYETYREENGAAVFGGARDAHAAFLAKNPMPPLGEMTSVTNEELLAKEPVARRAFYAHARALTGYLIAEKGMEAMVGYLADLSVGSDGAEAFRKAFGPDVKGIEIGLRGMIAKRAFPASTRQLVPRTKATGEGTAGAPAGRSFVNAHLADLLIRSKRLSDGESLLQATLAADPDSAEANAVLGMLRVRQHRPAEARVYLEKAAAKLNDHLVLFTLAKLISEDTEDGGDLKTERVRPLLKRALEIAPSHAASHELLAHVSAKNGDDLEGALAGLDAALTHDPGNVRYLLRKGEVLRRLSRLDEAADVVSVVRRSGPGPDALRWAGELEERIGFSRNIRALRQALIKEYRDGAARLGDATLFPGGHPSSRVADDQAALLELAQTINTVNAALKRPDAGEERVLGRIYRVICENDVVRYSVLAEGGQIELMSPDIAGVRMRSFVNLATFEIACDADLSKSLAVLIFSRGSDPKMPPVLTSIEFVPEEFVYMRGTTPIILGQ